MCRWQQPHNFYQCVMLHIVIAPNTIKLTAYVWISIPSLVIVLYHFWIPLAHAVANTFCIISAAAPNLQWHLRTKAYFKRCFAFWENGLREIDFENGFMLFQRLWLSIHFHVQLLSDSQFHLASNLGCGLLPGNPSRECHCLYCLFSAQSFQAPGFVRPCCCLAEKHSSKDGKIHGCKCVRRVIEVINFFNARKLIGSHIHLYIDIVSYFLLPAVRLRVAAYNKAAIM